MRINNSGKKEWKEQQEKKYINGFVILKIIKVITKKESDTAAKDW